ncbi:hypothetical protein E2542_SST03720 [Spatholobus suberectus]|nr:hypothetical protein E2542_SST03720 [Spatholobus suberectus]
MQANSMAATTSSSSCSGFFSLRSPNPVRDSSSSGQGSSGCGKFDGVAMWFINGVTMAFFASLNRCSCIRIATEEDGEDANDDMPLMLNDGNLRHDGLAAGSASRRRTGTGKKKSAAVLVDED